MCRYVIPLHVLAMCSYSDHYFVALGIPPEVEILQFPGSPITVEPDRPFHLTCVSSGDYVGSVEWTRPGTDTRTCSDPNISWYNAILGQVQVPMEETERGVLFRENLNVSSERLVAGIGGIQQVAEGEYICNATNGITHASVSVIIDVRGMHTTIQWQQCHIILGFSTSRGWCCTGINFYSILY